MKLAIFFMAFYHVLVLTSKKLRNWKLELGNWNLALRLRSVTKISC